MPHVDPPADPVVLPDVNGVPLRARMVATVQDALAFIEVCQQVWGAPTVEPDMVLAVASAGSYALVVEDASGPVGAAMGLCGPPAARSLHSHIVGVSPSARGLGRHIKWHQAAWCRERDISTMTWTFDPLLARNAYFNLTVLGARADRYLVDHYGDMTDPVNQGQGSDRLLARWDLTEPRAFPAMTTSPPPDEPGVPALLEPVDDEPVSRGMPAGNRCRISIPTDIEALRRDRPELGRRWRAAVRSAMTDLLSAGWRITHVSRHGDYHLETS